MTQVEFMRRWMWAKPAQVKRRAWHRLGMAINHAQRAVGFAFQHPRLWWFCRRCDLHFRFGFPMPPKPPYAITA